MTISKLNDSEKRAIIGATGNNCGVGNTGETFDIACLKRSEALCPNS